MGWLNPKEADALVTFFFRDMMPLSQVVDDLYTNSKDPWYLVIEQPFLCCVILMLSSRYHGELPGHRGEIAGYLLHQRLWDFCQKLLLQIMLGQETFSGLKLRTWGAIEGLLLLLEWHPILTQTSSTAHDNIWTDKDSGIADVPTGHIRALNNEATTPKWLHDIIDRTRQSDRMSLFIMSVVLVLANELGLLDDQEPSQMSDLGEDEFHGLQRRAALMRLLYVHGELHCLRTGSKSMMPESIRRTIPAFLDSWIPPFGHCNYDRSYTIAARAELVTIARSIFDTLFSSNAVIHQVLQSGRHLCEIQRFGQMLESWENQHLKLVSTRYAELLTAEYNITKILLHSINLQAVALRMAAQPANDRCSSPVTISAEESKCIKVIIEGALEILRSTLRLFDKNLLKYASTNMFIRIPIAATLLVKGLSLGVENNQLESSLSLLSRVSTALEDCTPDEMHLASQYAALITECSSNLRRRVIFLERQSRRGTQIPDASSVQPSALEPMTDSDQWNEYLLELNSLPPVFVNQEPERTGETWPDIPLHVQFFQEIAQGFYFFGDGMNGLPEVSE
ncbi:hypothetical protein FOYG_16072 [Fusarium oxysporum NRRL 32931]|nr:hypothetical protein FOYG_16072 [Fusarium oxysporum NRRL 32931]